MANPQRRRKVVQGYLSRVSDNVDGENFTTSYHFHACYPLHKVHIDTMHLPVSGGYKYIIQARCSLTTWPEFQKLKKETARTVGLFIVVFLLWRWGCLHEIITDNGPAMLAALKWLEENYKYDIKHIRISGYNSRSNGSVEATHRPIREALIKTGGGSLKGWHKREGFVFWAERITTRKSIGMSPFYAVHGVEPLLPFDLTHATHFVPDRYTCG